MYFSQSFSPTINIILLLGLIFVIFFSFRDAIVRFNIRFVVLLVLLRCVALACLVLFIFQPYFVEKQLDKRHFSLMLLADVSGSVQTSDNSNILSRLDIMKLLIEGDDSSGGVGLVDTLRSSHGIEVVVFSDRIMPFSTDWSNKPGENRSTAIGNSILEIIDTHRNKDKPLAGIVLLSDGNSNIGIDDILLFKRLREESIPVTVIGVGDLSHQTVLSASFDDQTINTYTGEDTEIPVTVNNSGDKELQISLRLESSEGTVKSASISIDAHETLNHIFNVNTDYLGIQSLELYIDSTDSDNFTETSKDILERSPEDTLFLFSRKSPQIEILYVSNQLSPDFQYIKSTLSREETLVFDSIIKLTENKFYTNGVDHLTTYPNESTFWSNYDAILMNTNVLPQLGEEGLTALKDFVDHHGGGLLLFGELPAKELDHVNGVDAIKNEYIGILGGLLPGIETRRIELEREQVTRILWQAIDAPSLKDMAVIPEGTRIEVLTDHNIAVNTVVWNVSEESRAAHDGIPLLQVQNYGAGKSAYWSLPESWRWAIHNESSSDVFEHFWKHMVIWLGKGAIDRITLPGNKYFYSIEDESELVVDVTDTGFLPASNALVEAKITTSNGQKDIPLLPDQSTPGRYRTRYNPSTPGIHEISYTAILPSGEALQKESLMHFSHSITENTQTAFNPAFLKELAFITGGVYYHYSDVIKDTSGIRIATMTDLPEIEIRKSLTDNIYFLIILTLLLGSEWILRRRWGLS